MPFGKDQTGVAINNPRLNGLRLEAYKQRRTLKAQLDLILEQAGIKNISTKDFEKILKETGAEFLLAIGGKV